ncbi:hypothetical protein GOP47_0024742 [Adiantum capillus-veneris]|uniref:Large ribosomal subunit protein uL4m n=1 Tax=Adiantum capillus-veneris TaxID=13818 RepID=A0A9D4Z4M2_ADICA|nr:hypothetical protein GOP47_0024742 [Adiantum capillus-veneris]
MNNVQKCMAMRALSRYLRLQSSPASVKPQVNQPWLSAQRRVVSYLRATHAGGEKQGCYNDIEMKVTNFNNEDKGTALLAGDVFDVPIRRDIVHRVVVWQLAKRRQGTHSTKTISEVSGTGRKPYKQKGTGQARHGTLRGPQFRHGARMHGPKPRDYSYTLPKKVRRLGLKIALSARVAEGKLLIFDDVSPSSHKTKEMAKYIEGIEQCKRVLIVDGTDKVNTLLCRATSNLYAADVLPAKGLNVYSILQHDALIMSLDAIRLIENRMHTPINR